MGKRKVSLEPPSSDPAGKRLRRDPNPLHEDPTKISYQLDSESSSESDTTTEICGEDITIAIFCALPYEAVAVKYSLDEEYTCHPRSVGSQKYVYSYGRIKHHKVVIARPHYMGTVQAAHCASAVRQQFVNVRFALMVGIGAGIPDASRRDIQLGDVAVSIPRDNHPGVTQYDYGKYELDGFVQKGPLNKPPEILVSADGSLEEDEEMGKNRHLRFLRHITAKNPMYKRPEGGDILFDSNFHHVKQDANCEECEATCDARHMSRPNARQPLVHRGLILSGGEVIKHPRDLERLRRNHKNAICFEMEAAGIMDEIPCIVIRGICDYADTHKQNGWHRYASAVAAAYCKALLFQVPEQRNEDTKTLSSLSKTVEQLSNQIKFFHERVLELEQYYNRTHPENSEDGISYLGLEKDERVFYKEDKVGLLEDNNVTPQYMFSDPVVLDESISPQEQKDRERPPYSPTSFEAGQEVLPHNQIIVSHSPGLDMEIFNS